MKDGIDSPYIIHKRPEKRIPSKQKTHYTQVSPEELSRAFQAARDKTGLFKNLPTGKNPPTFHEIRSLGIRLYREMGTDDNTVMSLSGHATREMYELYLSRVEPQWITCENDGLKI